MVVRFPQLPWVGVRDAASGFQEIRYHEVDPSTLSVDVQSRRFTRSFSRAPGRATRSRFTSGVDEPSASFRYPKRYGAVVHHRPSSAAFVQG